MSALERLKNLFRDLFQLDVADLDFGIYRLLHLKRKEVETFLTKDLPAAVDKEFKAAAGAEKAMLEKDLKDLADRIRQDIGPDALQPNGEPAPTYANAKLVKDYSAKRKQVEAIEATEAQKAEVFNHLYTFFRRYYDEGDFIPRRFYGARESYAVPYNGEEVLFHWANKDQHYVKTGEVFRDYAFKIETLLGTFTVRFKLTQATTSKDNTKGDVRFFFALPKDAEYDKAAKVFVVPFEYRLPTEAEVQRYGSGAKGQDALTVEAPKKILAVVPDDGLKGELAKVVDIKNLDDAAKREEVTLLLKRLRHFTKKNTTDYFIHKNLGGFLRQELEFYIKDQVVQAADLEGDFDAKRRMLRVFRALAEQVITFLHQIEDAQRRLFEKKKFVLRTDYLIPIMHVPRELWPEVLANKAQIAEWKDLFAIEPKKDLPNKKGAVNEQFLAEHPTLVVNTAFFTESFADALKSSASDLEGMLQGVIIHGENRQALSFLGSALKHQVSCVYMDPPYNKGNDGFIYKDCYRHSSWAAMVHGRLVLLRETLLPSGFLFCSIDENEIHNVAMLLASVPLFSAGVAVIQTNPKGRGQDRFLATSHDYLVLAYRVENAELRGIPKGDEHLQDYRHEDKNGRYRLLELRNTHREFNRGNRPNLWYPLYVDPETGSVSLEKSRKAEEIFPVWEDGFEGCWTWGKELAAEQADLLIGRNVGGRWKVFRKGYWGRNGERPTFTPKTIWDDREVQTEVGQAILDEILGARLFPSPKPPALVRRAIQLSTDMDGVVLDPFAGSGTTGHAVIEQNRNDQGRRRFVLIEMGEYFDSVLIPRIQKVMFAPDWEAGSPKRMVNKQEIAATPRMVKVLRLESYEDALHNAAEAAARGRTAKKAEVVRATAGEERYRLNYLVKLPLEASDTMLNVEKLEHPFTYTIEVLTDDGPREQVVDLVETFNWLYGLRVKRLLAWEAKQGKETRKYRVVVATDRDNRKRILVVWRDMTGLDPRAERAFLEAEIAKLGEFEEKWINGDCAVPGFASLDGLFKRLMENEG